MWNLQVVVRKMTEILFKVIIIGDPTVGKTSFVQRYVNDSYRRDYKMTIGGTVIVLQVVSTLSYITAMGSSIYGFVSN